MNRDDAGREQARQAALLKALWDRDNAPLDDWLRDPDAPLTLRGLQAYDANAGASAERALAASFPTVLQLIGEEAFGALARACWRAHPPTRGDLARFGDTLPRFVAEEDPLPDVPYLGDCARLDWAMAEAERAADVEPAPESFSLLADHDPDALMLVCAPGMVLVRSPHPIVTIWRAHEVPEEAQARLAAASVAIADRRGEIALVWRRGWKARVEAVDQADARWCEALLSGLSLGRALQSSIPGFAFEPWLLQALHARWVVGVRVL